jgi:hypothetical protein
LSKIQNAALLVERASVVLTAKYSMMRCSVSNNDHLKSGGDSTSQLKSLSSYFELKGLLTPGHFRAKDFHEYFSQFLRFPGHEIEFHYVRDPTRSQVGLIGVMPDSDVEGQGLIDSCCDSVTAQCQTALNFATAESCVFEVKTTVDPQHNGFYEESHQRFVDAISLDSLGRYALVRRLENSQFEALKGPAGTQVKGVKVGGAHSVGFSELFSNVHHTVSWRMSVVLKTGHRSAQDALYKSTRLKRFVDFLLGTRLLGEHNEEMISLARDCGELLQSEVSFHVWDKDPREESRNVWMLDSMLHGMGVSDLADGGVVSLSQALRYLPMSRPGSAWRTGHVMFSTLDGKAIHYSPCSWAQRAYTELVYDARGQSIETYHATMNRALIASRKGLPRIGRITIGRQPDSFVEALQCDVVEAERHLVIQKTLTPAIEDAVNIFGTSYGVQTAAEFERWGISSFLTMLCSTQSEKIGDDRSIHDLFRIGINEVYHQHSEAVCPKWYTQGVCKPVDDALANLMVEVPESWWGVVNLLHEHELCELAMQAQHYAVPVLADFVRTLQDSPAIHDAFYGMKDWNTDEPIVAVVSRRILEAIEAWPALSHPTRFDIGVSRIVTINVSSDGHASPSNKRWTEAMLYLLARSSLIRRDFNMRQHANTHLIPDAFRAYHQRVADEEEPVGRKLCYSQYQNISDFLPVVECLTADLRSCRSTGSAVTIDTDDIKSLGRYASHMFTTYVTLAPETLYHSERTDAYEVFGNLDVEGFVPNEHGINLLFSAFLLGDVHDRMGHKLFLPLRGAV